MAEDPFAKKYKKLNAALTDLIQGYSLVTFVPLAINDKERMMNVKNQVDKANGFCYGSQVRKANESYVFSDLLCLQEKSSTESKQM